MAWSTSTASASCVTSSSSFSVRRALYCGQRSRRVLVSGSSKPITIASGPMRFDRSDQLTDQTAYRPDTAPVPRAGASRGLGVEGAMNEGVAVDRQQHRSPMTKL